MGEFRWFGHVASLAEQTLLCNAALGLVGLLRTTSEGKRQDMYFNVADAFNGLKLREFKVTKKKSNLKGGLELKYSRDGVDWHKRRIGSLKLRPARPIGAQLLDMPAIHTVEAHDAATFRERLATLQLRDMIEITKHRWSGGTQSLPSRYHDLVSHGCFEVVAIEARRFDSDDKLFFVSVCFEGSFDRASTRAALEAVVHDLRDSQPELSCWNAGALTGTYAYPQLVLNVAAATTAAAPAAAAGDQ